MSTLISSKLASIAYVRLNKNMKVDQIYVNFDINPCSYFTVTTKSYLALLGLCTIGSLPAFDLLNGV